VVVEEDDSACIRYSNEIIFRTVVGGWWLFALCGQKKIWNLSNLIYYDESLVIRRCILGCVDFYRRIYEIGT